MASDGYTTDVEQIEQAFETLALDPGAQAVKGPALSLLAIGSREDARIRDTLGEPEVLIKLLEVVMTSPRDDLEATIAALRCIGNACTVDTARETVLRAGLAWAVQCLDEGDHMLQLIAAKVLYNICYEFEPAQYDCYRLNIQHRLIAILSRSSSDWEVSDRTLVLDLLLSITGQKTKENNEVLPGDLLENLVCLPDRFTDVSDVQDFETSLEILLGYLTDPETQAQVIEQRLVAEVWKRFQQTERMLRMLPAQMPREDDDDEEIEDQKLLTALSTTMTWSLSDIAASSRFAEVYPLQDPLISDLILVLTASNIIANGTNGNVPGLRSERTINAACQVVGNYFLHLSTEILASTIMQLKLYENIYKLMMAVNDAELLHSATGLLVQMTRPSVEVRATMGADGSALPAIEKVCGHATSQLKQDGLRLLRALGRECPQNQERFASLAQQTMASVATAQQPDAGTEDMVVNAG
ncbi:hypothetical protein Tdes44962_MAKER05083 [Teratosphaeria destructans]|uniref:ARM repeat-containing protein n=1 Tax=Teratosphaeria destructans TaxID=418781 RepID=A0A9W7VZL8_9PEZI|nr:hypothetical protein Tdes44962_MAKER05083 [Teratosphaeria destructans]